MPTPIAQAEGDSTAARAKQLLDAIAATQKVLVTFTKAEGAGGHCETMARSLFNQRVFDWLDDTLR